MKFRSKALLLERDLSERPFQLDRVKKVDYEIDASSDDDQNIMLNKPTSDVDMPYCSDQEIFKQIIDIDPEEWVVACEESITASQEPAIADHGLNDLEENQFEALLNDDIGLTIDSQTPIIKARKKKMIVCDASSSVKSDVFVKPQPIELRDKQKRTLQENSKRTKKKRLDYSNPYFELEAAFSEESVHLDDEDDSNLDLDRNLSGLIAESPTVDSQEINFYRKSLLSPELGGLGTRKHRHRFITPKRYEPCTQLLPDSDTPGSLANFVVDDESLPDDKSETGNSLCLDDLLETCSDD